MGCPSNINPWLCEKLKEKGLLKDPPGNQGPMLNLLIEIEPSAYNDVASYLQKMGLSPSAPFFFGKYIEVRVPSALVPQIASIPGVKKINYNMPVSIGRRINDPLLGQLENVTVEIPPFPNIPLPAPPGSPVHQNYLFIPTSVSRKVLELPEDSILKKTLIAVVDTGSPWSFHPQVQGLTLNIQSFVPGEALAYDNMGHGTWCTTASMGKSAQTTYGLVQGSATAGNTVIVAKVLDVAGSGDTSWIIKGMEWAYLQGAKVISLSLGGTPQGGVNDDPFCDVVNTLYNAGTYSVIAAGNSGPDDYTIGSPGFCPKALTVGAYSITDKDVSYFSSRGPSASWYKTHKEQWEQDYEEYGDYLIKPDVVAPGGGRASEKSTPQELLYSGCMGWFCGFYDGQPLYPFEGMMGTSMATPQVAGLVALAIDTGKIFSTDQVKNKMSASWGDKKSNSWGWGLIKWPVL